MTLRLLSVGLGLSAGAFIWQAAGDHLWNVAIERAWFQVVALIAVAIVLKVFPIESV